MTCTQRFSVLGTSSVALLLLFAACAPGIRVSASPGETPGLSVLGSGSYPSADITVESLNGFSGPVTLTPTCCLDVIRQRWVPFDHFSAPGTEFFDPYVWTLVQPISIPANGSNFLRLPFMNLRLLPYGKYVVNVSVLGQGAGIRGDARVGLLKRIATTEVLPSCASSGKVTALLTALQAEITLKENDPSQTKTVLALYNPDYPSSSTLPVGCQTCDALRWEIDDDASLSDEEAVITLNNSVPSGWEKEITTAGCSSSPKTIRVQGGQQKSMTIRKAEDTTLIFRKPTGILALGGWVNVTVLAEPAFWSVFGGKKHTFTWMRD